MDEGLAREETQTGERALEMARASNQDRIADICVRAKAAITRSMAELNELIAIGGISAQETAERQILLDAFARRMGI